MSLKLAVIKEQAAGERRVALDPTTAHKLVGNGVAVSIEADAGAAAGFPDASYNQCTVESSQQALLGDADIVVWVQPPAPELIAQIKPGAVVCGLVFPHREPTLLKAMQQRQLSCLALEMVPRITRAQAMDVLSSQATVAGYQAVLLAADLSPRLFPMLTTAAGTLRPSKVVVIGAGVAGLQAIATARRLGAQVEAYDIRPAAREQVESLGARMIDTGVNAEGEGGYARELTAEEREQQAQVLAQHLSKADVVISTAALPGRPAPKIITEAMVKGMNPGAVILDMAAESGGNCELTQVGETRTIAGVSISGPLNLASRSALHASEMYARNIANLLALVQDGSTIQIDREDEIIAGCLLVHGDELVHASARAALENTTGGE
ncbi:MAG: NAD(P) transhydrogenase subunit alpha [Wenzhouxiangellaceae bacterium]